MSRVDLKTIDVRLNDPVVTSVVFAAQEGWDYVLSLAKWVNGIADRDEHEGQREKTHYWSIAVYGKELPDVYIGTARPGDVFLKHKSGRISIMKRDDFEETYVFNDHSGTFPCYFSYADARYHRRIANHAKCSLHEIDTEMEEHTNTVAPSILCVRCFGTW